MFTSNRNGFIPPKAYTNPTMQPMPTVASCPAHCPSQPRFRWLGDPLEQNWLTWPKPMGMRGFIRLPSRHRSLSPQARPCMRR